MIVEADARCLPWGDRTFDFVFTSPPWDDLDVLTQARPELTRVLTRKGLMALLLPNRAAPAMATLVVTNRDWTERQEFIVEKPSGVVGPRYFSPSDDFVRRVLVKYRPKRLLDPFCGTGTIPRIARTLGIRAEGSDIAPVAVAV